MNPPKKKTPKKLDISRLIGKDPSQTQIIAHPNDIERLIQDGVIKRRFITYKDYSDDLFIDRKKHAVNLLSKLPAIDDSIADSVVTSIYEEIRSSYAFGVFTSAIFNSILLLEYAMRARLYKEKIQDDPNTQWAELEKKQMGNLITQLFKKKVINRKQSDTLRDFSENLRNPYLHFNIFKLIEKIGVNSLPKLNIETGETSEEVGVKANKYRSVWFSAKQFFDREIVQYVIEFCVHWTNMLLVDKEVENITV